MKKSILSLALLFTLILAVNLQAQIKIGVVGGLNFSSVDIETDGITQSSNTNFGIGGIIELPVYKMFTIQLEPCYLRKGTDFKEEGNPLDFVFETNYIELPVLVKVNFGIDYPYLFAGPTVGYLLTSELRTELDGIQFTGDLKDVTEQFDYGISFGTGFEKSLGFGNLFFEARYTLGLYNCQKGGSFEMKGGPVSETLEWEKDRDEYKNNGLQVMAGVKIPLKF